MPGQPTHVAVGSANDVTNVNQALTDQFSNWLQTGGGVNGFGTLAGLMADPEAATNAFLGQAPNVQNLVFGATNPLAQANAASLAALTPGAVQGVADQFAGGGIPLSSSAFGQHAAQAVGGIQANLANQLAQHQTQMAGNLLGGLQTTLGQQQLGAQQTLANLFGTQTQGLGSISQNEWWQPTYVENPNHMGWGEIAGLGMDALGLAFGMPPGVTSALKGLFGGGGGVSSGAPGGSGYGGAVYGGSVPELIPSPPPQGWMSINRGMG